MKLIVKILGGLFILLILAAAAVRLFVHEAEPVGTPSPEADVLTEKMFKAINKPAWDSTAIISWNFGGRQKHLWDKTRHLGQVEWGDKKVLLNIQNITGKAFENGTELTGEAAQTAIKTAWNHFNKVRLLGILMFGFWMRMDCRQVIKCGWELFLSVDWSLVGLII